MCHVSSKSCPMCGRQPGDLLCKRATGMGWLAVVDDVLNNSNAGHADTAALQCGLLFKGHCFWCATRNLWLMPSSKLGPEAVTPTEQPCPAPGMCHNPVWPHLSTCQGPFPSKHYVVGEHQQGMSHIGSQASPTLGSTPNTAEPPNICNPYLDEGVEHKHEGEDGNTLVII